MFVCVDVFLNNALISCGLRYQILHWRSRLEANCERFRSLLEYRETDFLVDGEPGAIQVDTNDRS